MYKSQKLFETNLYGNIIYNMLGMEAYIEYLNKSDKTVLKDIGSNWIKVNSIPKRSRTNHRTESKR